MAMDKSVKRNLDEAKRLQDWADRGGDGGRQSAASCQAMADQHREWAKQVQERIQELNS